MEPSQAPGQSSLNTNQSFVQKFKPLFLQLLKFGVVGVLNTGIDFGIVNALSYLTGVTSGNGIIPIKGIGFLTANINSYIINKRWTFNDNTTGQTGRLFSIYVSVSAIGMLLSISVVYLITTYVDPMFGMSEQLWLNVANLAATAVSMVWNFLGYKLIVFRGK